MMFFPMWKGSYELYIPPVVTRALLNCKLVWVIFEGMKVFKGLFESKAVTPGKVRPAK